MATKCPYITGFPKGLWWQPLTWPPHLH